jgi:hypothetical protein
MPTAEDQVEGLIAAFAELRLQIGIARREFLATKLKLLKADHTARHSVGQYKKVFHFHLLPGFCSDAADAC